MKQTVGRPVPKGAAHTTGGAPVKANGRRGGESVVPRTGRRECPIGRGWPGPRFRPRGRATARPGTRAGRYRRRPAFPARAAAGRLTGDCCREGSMSKRWVLRVGAGLCLVLLALLLTEWLVSTI